MASTTVGNQLNSCVTDKFTLLGSSTSRGVAMLVVRNVFSWITTVNIINQSLMVYLKYFAVMTVRTICCQECRTGRKTLLGSKIDAGVFSLQSCFLGLFWLSGY